MSMELYILSDAMAPSIEAWQQAIEARGFALRLSTERSFEDLSGALPVRINDVDTAFECGHCNAAELMAEWPEITFGHPWTYALALRWGADLRACVAAYVAAAGYAEATGGVVLDCEEGNIISAQRAAEIAREIEQQIPMIEAAMARVTAQYRS